MNESNGQPLDPVELVSLPAGDARREAFAQGLTDPAERAHWEREWAASDRMRALLPQVDLPASLEGRLLEIPAAGAASGRKAGGVHFGWRAVAAMLVIAGMLAGVFMWRPWEARRVPMDRAVSKSIAAWAVKGTARPLEIASADTEAVRKKLESYGFDFPVLMLAPSGGVTLQGGGSCDFGTANAVYTKWAGAGFTCTLYEFNGKDVSAPPLFDFASETPQELWQDDLHYRVMIFPGSGGKCCWALVMDTDKAENVFSKYMTGSY